MTDLLADFIGRQNQPILSITCYGLYSVSDPSWEHCGSVLS